MKQTLLILMASLLLQSFLAEEIVAPAIPDPAQSMAGFCANYPRPAFAKFELIPYPDDWFKLYKINDGVTVIAEPHQWQEVISYLIEGESSALLFDTGNGIGDIASVVRFLTDKPVKVLNSHSHYDHVGGNHQFENILALDTEYGKAHQAGYELSAVAEEVSHAALCQELPADVSVGEHHIKPYRANSFIKEGEIIDLGGRQLEVLSIPGHTPDSIALIDRKARLMWTGDTYYSGPIWLFVAETDLAAYEHTLERLVELQSDVDYLLPAHNTPWEASSVLTALEAGFQQMLEGNTERINQGDGMIEHKIPGEQRFSFLMRDEVIPYQKSL